MASWRPPGAATGCSVQLRSDDALARPVLGCFRHADGKHRETKEFKHLCKGGHGMIKKIYAFNDRGETLFRRLYANTLSDDEVRACVSSTPDCSFIRSTDTVVYRQFEAFNVCFVVENENEMYVLSLISYLMNLMERLFGSINEITIVYNFKDCHVLIDNFILNGKVIALDPLEITSACHVSDQ